MIKSEQYRNKQIVIEGNLRWNCNTHNSSSVRVLRILIEVFEQFSSRGLIDINFNAVLSASMSRTVRNFPTSVST